MFDRYSGKSQEIKNLQPAGTDLAPEVAVEFFTGKGEFLVEKRFLNGPECRLYQKNNDKWELLAEEDNADRRTIELIGGEQAGGGATKPQHWGMLRYLWARQDELAAWPVWEGAAGRRIRSVLARVEVDPLGDALEAALSARFQECFTATGQIKKSGTLQAVEIELDALEKELQTVEEKRGRTGNAFQRIVRAIRRRIGGRP